MSNKRNNIHIFRQAKGGVGKTVGSTILAQYLDDCVGAENIKNCRLFADMKKTHGKPFHDTSKSESELFYQPDNKE